MALDFIAGCIGGCTGILVGHPFDTIKVRIQTQDFRNPMYKGTFDCFRNIVRNESFTGLYKGLSSPLAGIAIINAIVFGVYGNLQKNLPDPDSLTSHFLAGGIAGLVQSFICSPMELAKTRLQIQTKGEVKGPLHCLSLIRQTEGVRGVFRGLNMTFLREGIGFGVYFAVYEWLTRTEDSQPVGTARLLVAGGSSGAACWLCTYPFDVVKSRIQADGISGKKVYQNSLDCFMKSLRSEGLGFLFRGLSPTLIRAFPTNAATWAVFTWIMRMFTNTDDASSKQHQVLEMKETKSLISFPSIYSMDYFLINDLCTKYLPDEPT